MLVTLTAPNGVEVNVPEHRVERLKELGYVEPKPKRRAVKAKSKE